MKQLSYILILVCLMHSYQCNHKLANQLQGEWVNMDEIQSPDIIFFHKNGRYIVLNYCEYQPKYYKNQPPQYGIPIIERGSWMIKNKTIVLSNRQFTSKTSSLSKHHEKDSLLSFEVKQASKEALILNFKGGKQQQMQKYRKVKRFPAIIHKYHDFGPSIKKLIIPPPSQTILLRLKYNRKIYVVGREEPIELVIEDQDKHEIWRKTLTFTDEVKTENILLVDNPEITQLSELIFKINAGKNSPSWDIKAILY